jgi:CHAT domain-containing protein
MTDSPGAGAHPDLETLSAYVDGMLSVQERTDVEIHLTACDECFDLVSEVMAAQRSEASIRGPEAISAAAPLTPAADAALRRRKTVRWTVSALAIAAAIVMVIWLQAPRLGVGDGPADPRFANLVAAVGESRYVEGRLTGGFPHGDLQGTRRSGSVAQQNLSLLAAAGELQKAAQADPSPTNLHAYGVAQLLLADYDSAVANLEAAAGDEPGTARFLNDLAVAYSERSVRGDRPDDLPKAFEAADRALILDASLIEARFTRALVLERLGMRERARAAWQDYLAHDATTAWAEEARRHLAALETQPAQARWQSLEESFRAGTLSDEEITLAARDVPDVIPELLLSRLDDGRHGFHEKVAARFADATGDDSLARALAATRDAAATTHALPALAEGYRLLNQDRYLDAEPHLEAAVAGLASGQPLLADWARYARARVRYFRGDFAGGLADLNTVHQRAVAHSAPALRARAQWISGLVEFSRGDWAAARRHYVAATESFAAVKDAQGVATVQINLSILARFLGDWPLVWRYRVAALQRLPLHRPTLNHGVLVSTAISASLQDLARTALMFFDEAVQNAARSASPFTRAETLLHRAKIFHRLEDYDSAARDLDEAGREYSQVADPVVQSRLRLALLTASAQVRGRRNPRQAADDAREAIAFTTERGDLLRSAELHLHRARALRALDDRAGAVTAVEQGIADFVKARQSLPVDDPTRLSAVEPVWDLFDVAVQLRWTNEAAPNQVDRDALFRALEASRANTLRELRVGDAMALDQVRARLTPDRALVLLHQQQDALCVWIIGRDDEAMLTVPVSAAQAAALVDAYRRRLALGASTTDAAARLSADVLGPILARAPADASLVIVPDEPYSRLPWAALPDPSSGDVLVARRAVSVAPSAAMAVATDPVGAQRADALVVAAGDADSELPVLAGARAEARAISALYTGGVFADGVGASASAVLQQLPKFTVVHLAAHAVNNAAYPLLSRLVLYPDAQHDGGLRVADLLRGPRLAPASVVVLAACTTAGTVSRRGEGAVGLAWGFLAAGAASVVATLWDVDDRAVAPLFVDFHRRLASGGRPADALRAAQLAARDRGEPAHVWAAVQVVGQP